MTGPAQSRLGNRSGWVRTDIIVSESWLLKHGRCLCLHEYGDCFLDVGWCLIEVLILITYCPKRALSALCHVFGRVPSPIVGLTRFTNSHFVIANNQW